MPARVRLEDFCFESSEAATAAMRDAIGLDDIVEGSVKGSVSESGDLSPIKRFNINIRNMGPRSYAKMAHKHDGFFRVHWPEWAWIRAANLPGRAFQLYALLWHLAVIEDGWEVRIPSLAPQRYGVKNRQAMADALRELAGAELIRVVSRDNGGTVVRVKPLPDEKPPVD